MKYGLLEGARDVQAYIFGEAKIPCIRYNESGDWEKWLPKYEYQAEKFETNGCTVWGTQNQIETFHNFLYRSEPNYSENFTYLLTPVHPDYGCDPQSVYECIRREGLVNNNFMPTPDNKAEFLDVSRIDGTLRARGQYWLVNHEFMHEWLWIQRPENYLELMKEALKTSPLGVSVSAWHHDQDGSYIDAGFPNNHWCMVYKIDENGIYVFDSYDATKKRLSLDHNIGRAKRIWLNTKTRKDSQRHVRVLTDILKALKLMKPTLLDVCTANLGKDVTPKDVIDDEVACAETVTTILQMVYADMPIITGTYTLWQHMKSPTSNFVEVNEPEPGAIIISPTGTGKYGCIGHVGIIDDNGIIMSNNSFGQHKGQFTQNYTFDTWTERYKNQHGMPIFFFKHV